MTHHYRSCRVCGTSWFDTYLSARGLCQSCARHRALAQVDAAYEVASSLKAPTEGDTLTGHDRALEYMGEIHAEVVELFGEVRAKRTRKTIAPSS